MAEHVPWLGAKIPDWYKLGACNGMGHELFFREDLEDLARRFCSSCPVKAPCQAWAVEDASLVGVWGGTSTQDRRRLRRARRQGGVA